MNSVQPTSLVAERIGSPRLANLLVGRSPRLAVDRGGATETVLLALGAAARADTHIACAAAGFELSLSAPWSWLRGFLPDDYADVALAALPEALALPVAEMAMEPVLAALGTLFGETPAVTAILGAAKRGWCDLSLAVAERPLATLSLGPEAERRLIERLETQAPNPAQALSEVAPVALYVALGSQSFAEADLPGLVEGAVVLVPAADPTRATLFAGPRFARIGTGRLQGARMTVEELRTQAMSDEDTEGADATDTDPDAPDDGVTVEDLEGTLDELEFRLDFVLGRATLTLDQLRELGVGSSVPLDSPATPAVAIYSAGRRIGEGEVVMIDDALGVRITRISRRADDRDA
jgi:type III secretion system YscQ/HrcQ family protein